MRRFLFFLKLMSWFSLRQFKTKYWRLFAVLLGIAVGAAVFTSIRLAVDASLDSFYQTLNVISGNSDLIISRPGGRMPDDLAARLNKLPEVETASPVLMLYVDIKDGKTAPFLLIGADPLLDAPLRSWSAAKIPDGDFSSWQSLVFEPGTLFLSQKLARAENLKAGDTVSLVHVNQVAPFKLLSVLKQVDLATADGGMIGLADISTVQEFAGLNGLVDRIDLKLKKDAGPETLDRIKSMLSPGLVMTKPSGMKQSGTIMARAYKNNLSLLSFVSLIVGMFLVYSLVAINTASRRRELAIIRSLGASSRLIFTMIITEGLLLGVCGWLLAIPLGTLLVKYMVKGVSTTMSLLFMRVHPENLHLDAWELVLSFVVTTFICVAAAYAPALEASRVSPRLAMRLHETPKRLNPSPYPSLIGLFLIFLVWPLTSLPFLRDSSTAGYSAVLSLMVGFALLSSPVMRLIGSRLPPLLRKIAGEPAFLGGRFLKDAGWRSAVSVGALLTAMALFVALVIMVHSFRGTVMEWTRQTISGDLFLRPAMSGQNSFKDSLPPAVVSGLKAIKGVDILPYKRVMLEYNNVPFQLESIEFALFEKHSAFMTMDVKMADILPLLSAGKGVLVSEVFSNQSGLKKGMPITIPVGDDVLVSTILGTVRDYRTNGGVVFVNSALYQALTGDLGWSGASLYFKDRNIDIEAEAGRLRTEIIENLGKHYTLEAVSGIELRRAIMFVFDETFSITTVLLLISLLVAGLGITTTLTVMVLERTLQLNTMQAIGASKAQIRSMIFWEAVFMVTAGEILGLISGFILSYILIYVINRQSFGWTFLYKVDWTSLIMSIPLILATALIAALPATYLVLKSSPAQALKEA